MIYIVAKSLGQKKINSYLSVMNLQSLLRIKSVRRIYLNLLSDFRLIKAIFVKVATHLKGHKRVILMSSHTGHYCNTFWPLRSFAGTMII